VFDTGAQGLNKKSAPFMRLGKLIVFPSNEGNTDFQATFEDENGEV
jgi:hypothetical protein